jgi:hypothetical protein
MNLVIVLDSAQMLFRNFGLRHAIAALGNFGMELAGPKAGRTIVALFARPAEWLRSRLGQQVPQESIKPQIQEARQVCVAKDLFPITANCRET